jgi:hypothetical protein
MADMQNKVPEVNSWNIAQFFGNSKAFKIPDYQREYAWEADEEVEALCSDLYGFYDSEDAYYLLGQTIIAQNVDARDSARYPLAVVDGQQRLTTLFLFAIAARDFLKPNLGIQGATQVNEALGQILGFVSPVDGQPVIRLRSNDSGHSYISLLIDGKSLGGDGHATETQRNISENIEFIRSFFSTKFDAPEKFIQFINKVLYSVFIIETVLVSQEHALDIFEKLNNRGRPLNSADLLKNLLFQQASITDYAKISEKWYEAAKNAFQVRPHKAASMEYLMKSLLGEKLGVGTSNKEVFKSWKSQLEGDVDMVDFAGELSKAAKFFKQVGSTVINKENETLVGARFFKTVQHFPLVVAGRELRQDSQKLEFLYRLIDARILLSLYGEEKSQSLDLTVWPWVKKIATLRNPSISDMYEISKDAFAAEKDLIEMGSVVFSRLNYERPKEKRRILFALSVVTNSFDIAMGGQHSIVATQSYLAAYKKGGYHLDHIYPKSLLSVQPSLEEANPWIHQPGNIALLTSQDNLKIQAAEPNLKSELYLSSQVLLTRVLASDKDNNLAGLLRKLVDDAHSEGHPTVADWGPAEVKARNEYLWQKFSGRLKSEVILSEYI